MSHDVIGLYQKSAEHSIKRYIMDMLLEGKAEIWVADDNHPEGGDTQKLEFVAIAFIPAVPKTRIIKSFRQLDKVNEYPAIPPELME